MLAQPVIITTYTDGFVAVRVEDLETDRRRQVELCDDHDKLPRISRDYGDRSAPVCAAKTSKP